MVGLLPVAESQGVNIYCPQDGLYSFFNSPYPAHRLTSGIDIYPETSYAPSPISGRVVKIKRVRAPRGRGFKDDGFDVATLIESSENPLKIVKILHVNPTVAEGEIIEVGQSLGTLIRSGYYGWATSPHIHVEVREPDDPLRARGGHLISRTVMLRPQNPLVEIRGNVVEVRPEYAILELDEGVQYGLIADVGGKPAVLDGGIPYYGWFGAHYNGDSPRGLTISLAGKVIGVINKVGAEWCQAEVIDFKVYVDGHHIRGLSLRLAPTGGAQLKVVPFHQGDLKLVVGSCILVEIV